jgi:YebC/PmpR family DNA-binding regulatory protein
MAGHSQFKNIMHRKGAQDAKRAKVFTKLIRELTVAARTGSPDPASNPRLRSAVIAARSANLPKDTMERAIKRGAGGEDTTQYEEVRYEGYGPGGVAFIVDALTDNRNRTAPEVRTAFSKHGGALGESNSVSFMFQRVGLVTYPASPISADEIFEAALESGANNVESTEDIHEVITSVETFTQVRDHLMSKFGEPQQASLAWKPQTTVAITQPDAAQTLMKLINVLEDNDDVQQVWANFEMSGQLLKTLD